MKQAKNSFSHQKMTPQTWRQQYDSVQQHKLQTDPTVQNTMQPQNRGYSSFPYKFQDGMSPGFKSKEIIITQDNERQGIGKNNFHKLSLPFQPQETNQASNSKNFNDWKSKFARPANFNTILNPINVSTFSYDTQNHAKGLNRPKFNLNRSGQRLQRIKPSFHHKLSPEVMRLTDMIMDLYEDGISMEQIMWQFSNQLSLQQVRLLVKEKIKLVLNVCFEVGNCYTEAQVQAMQKEKFEKIERIANILILGDIRSKDSNGNKNEEIQKTQTFSFQKGPKNISFLRASASQTSLTSTSNSLLTAQQMKSFLLFIKYQRQGNKSFHVQKLSKYFFQIFFIRLKFKGLTHSVGGNFVDMDMMNQQNKQSQSSRKQVCFQKNRQQKQLMTSVQNKRNGFKNKDTQINLKINDSKNEIIENESLSNHQMLCESQMGKKQKQSWSEQYNKIFLNNQVIQQIAIEIKDKLINYEQIQNSRTDDQIFTIKLIGNQFQWNYDKQNYLISTLIGLLTKQAQIIVEQFNAKCDYNKTIHKSEIVEKIKKQFLLRYSCNQCDKLQILTFQANFGQKSIEKKIKQMFKTSNQKIIRHIQIYLKSYLTPKDTQSIRSLFSNQFGQKYLILIRDSFNFIQSQKEFYFILNKSNSNYKMWRFVLYLIRDFYFVFMDQLKWTYLFDRAILLAQLIVESQQKRIEAQKIAINRFPQENHNFKQNVLILLQMTKELMIIENKKEKKIRNQKKNDKQNQSKKQNQIVRYSTQFNHSFSFGIQNQNQIQNINSKQVQQNNVNTEDNDFILSQRIKKIMNQREQKNDHNNQNSLETPFAIPIEVDKKTFYSAQFKNKCLNLNDTGSHNDTQKKVAKLNIKKEFSQKNKQITQIQQQFDIYAQLSSLQSDDYEYMLNSTIGEDKSGNGFAKIQSLASEDISKPPSLKMAVFDNKNLQSENHSIGKIRQEQISINDSEQNVRITVGSRREQEFQKNYIKKEGQNNSRFSKQTKDLGFIKLNQENERGSKTGNIQEKSNVVDLQNPQELQEIKRKYIENLKEKLKERKFKRIKKDSNMCQKIKNKNEKNNFKNNQLKRNKDSQQQFQWKGISGYKDTKTYFSQQTNSNDQIAADSSIMISKKDKNAQQHQNFIGKIRNFIMN